MNLALLQTEIQARLNADSYFTDITVLYEREKNISNEIARMMGAQTTKASKAGVFCIVGAYTLDVEHADVPGPDFLTALAVLVYENVPLNVSNIGTNKAAIDIAARVCQVLHHYVPTGLSDAVLCDKSAVRPQPPPVEGWIGYRVGLRVPAIFQADSKVAPVVVSPDSGAKPQTVTLTCATAAAAIYYTLDDSHPWSGNTTAVLYTTPIVVAAACALRAIAYKTGMIASDSALGLYT